MLFFIFNTILWSLALFGIFELIKDFINASKKFERNKYIITVKNGEDYIEGIIRQVINYVKDGELLIVDMGSTDTTKDIIYKLQLDYNELKLVEYKDITKG